MSRNSPVRGCVAITCVIFMALCCSAAFTNPDPPAWDAFNPASFFDVFLTPSLATDQLGYVLSLGANPRIVLGLNNYPVNWVQAYFVVSQDQVTDFDAATGIVPLVGGGKRSLSFRGVASPAGRMGGLIAFTREAPKRWASAISTSQATRCCPVCIWGTALARK